MMRINNDVIELKRKYNVLLEREKKAEEVFKTATDEQVDKWIPEFNKIIVGLSRLLIEIPGMTKDEIMNGFKDIEH